MSLNIEKLPFYWRLSAYKNTSTSNNIVKSNLDFSFSWDSKNNLLIQNRTPYLLEALNSIYQQEYNIGYLQDENTLAERYGEDFFSYLIKIFAKFDFISGDILEIGCGGCVLLEKLKQKGFNVTGIDSSPFATKSGKKKGIDVIEDFFPSEKINHNYDVIFCVDVLEHIDTYENFLLQQIDALNIDGLIIVNVPDATESIEKGDVSLAMHQHLNYFSEESLENLFRNVGLHDVHVEKANYGGSLYAVGRKKVANSSHNYVSNSNNLSINLETFSSKAEKTISSIRSHILESYKSHKKIGFYVPLRALPYVCNLPPNIQFRFFDDTPHWYGKKFDGMNVAIENMNDLITDPVDVVYVMSLTFGDVIRNKINSNLSSDIETYILGDFCE